jgi:hypothetical protein
MLGQFSTELWVAAERGDISGFTSVAGHIALLMGEVVVLHVVSHLLERVVSNLYFCFVQCWLTARCVAAGLDRLLLGCCRNHGSSRGRATAIIASLATAGTMGAIAQMYILILTSFVPFEPHF